MQNCQIAIAQIYIASIYPGTIIFNIRDDIQRLQNCSTKIGSLNHSVLYSMCVTPPYPHPTPPKKSWANSKYFNEAGYPIFSLKMFTGDQYYSNICY